MLVTERNGDPRISIRLSPAARQAVEEIMDIGHISTIQEAVRRAISDELFLMKQRREGWKVVLERDNQSREIQWMGEPKPESIERDG